MSVILITQNLALKGRYCSDISQKTKYLVLLINVRDKDQFMFFARQVYPEDSVVHTRHTWTPLNLPTGI